MYKQTITTKDAYLFIIACHGDLEAVKKTVAEHPDWVNAYNTEMNERALGAASHVGNRPIAEYLLAHGAELDIAAAAMLGRRDDVAAFLKKDPKLATSGGAHGIPIAFHAALSGDVELGKMLWDLGAGDEFKKSLTAAVHMGHVEMTRWLLEHGADTSLTDFQGNTPLQIAEKRGNTEIAALLREHGA